MTRNVDLARALVLAAAAAALAAPAAAQGRFPYSLTLYDQPDYRGGSVTFYGDNANVGSTGFATRARSAQIRGAWRVCEGGGYRNRCEVLEGNIRDLDAVGFGGRVGSAQSLGGAPAVTQSLPAAPPPRYAPVAPPAYQPQPQPQPAPYQAAPYLAPQAAAPAYAAPPAPRYAPPAEDLPPAVDAPLAAPSRFGRPYTPPPVAAAPQPAPYQPAPYQPDPYPQAPSYPAAPSYPPLQAQPAYGEGAIMGGSAVFFPAPMVRGADVAAWTSRAADGFCQAQGLGGAIYFDQSQRAARAVDLDGRALGEGPVLRDVLCRR